MTHGRNKAKGRFEGVGGLAIITRPIHSANLIRDPVHRIGISQPWMGVLKFSHVKILSKYSTEVEIG